MFRRKTFAGMAAAASLLVWAWTGDAAPKPKTHTITIVDAMTYEPATLTIRRGDSVVWVNKDVVQHTATATDAAFNSPSINPGGTWKYSPKKRGSLDYTCRFHPMMRGRLDVK